MNQQDNQRAALEAQFELPPLPKWMSAYVIPDGPGGVGEQWLNEAMQDYALAAIESDRKRRTPPNEPFVIVNDRMYEGEGPSLAYWNGENYQFTDGDCYNREGDTLDGYTAEFLTDHQLEKLLFDDRKRMGGPPVSYQVRFGVGAPWKECDYAAFDIINRTRPGDARKVRDAPQPAEPVKPFQGKVERHSDQSVLVRFPSCRLASEFERNLAAYAERVKGPSDEEIMAKVQEFASTWATAGGRFDDGTAMERAEACKEEIRALLARYGQPAAQAAEHAAQACNLQPVAAQDSGQDREDAERLDWLDQTNSKFKMGWRVGIAPAGNVSIGSIIQPVRVVTIREAIDAAMEQKT